MRALLAIATRKAKMQQMKPKGKKKVVLDEAKAPVVRRVGRPPNGIKKEKSKADKSLTEGTWQRVVEKYEK
jgi:hypothetical protein